MSQRMVVSEEGLYEVLAVALPRVRETDQHTACERYFALPKLSKRLKRELSNRSRETGQGK
jgi:hypothetical protein